MNTQDPLKQQVEEFNQRLAILAHHQRQAFILLSVDRLRRDWDKINKPLSAHQALLERAGRWFVQHLVAPLKQHRTRSAIAQTRADQIIDGNYRVLDLATDTSDSTSTAKGREQ